MNALQLVAVAAIIFREGRVLTMRRAVTKDAGAGLWETLSGRVAPGEHPLDAVRREVAEECGLEVAIEERPIDLYVAHRGAVPMTVIVYRAEWRAREVVRSHEHDDHRWVTPEEFRALTSLSRLADAVDHAR